MGSPSRLAHRLRWKALAPRSQDCETVDMKNITVSVDDETYRKARVRAAELDTSVSAVVQRFLAQFAEADAEFERRRKLQQDTLASIREFRATPRMTRDASHDRAALR